jgi:hypothetical protein
MKNADVKLARRLQNSVLILTVTLSPFSRATLVSIQLAIKLMHILQKRWHRLRGYKLLADVIVGIQFKDGAQVEQEAA